MDERKREGTIKKRERKKDDAGVMNEFELEILLRSLTRSFLHH